MKKITLLTAFLITLISCGYSPEEQMLFDYLNNASMKTLKVNINDLDFKIISLEKVKDISASDSLEIVQKYFDEKKNKKIGQFEDEIKRDEIRIAKNEELIRSINVNDVTKTVQEWVDKDKVNIERNQKNIELYNGDCKGTFLEPVLVKINNYKSEPNKILSVKYKANYSMNNPLMKVKQTFNKYYYSNSENTIFIKEEEIE